MNTTDDVKLIMQLLKTSIFLILTIHFSACLWFAIANSDKKWTPGQTKLFGTDDMNKNLYKDFNEFDKWVICIYTAVLALTGNDIYP